MKKKTDAQAPADFQPPRKSNNPDGRPGLEPTPQQRAQVTTLAGFGLTHAEIADALDFSADTLERHFPDELKKGAVKADATVLTNLYKIATGDTPQAAPAAMFWVKVRRRWHEVQRVIHGYDPEIVSGFVKQVVAMLRRALPEKCPHCQTRLDLPKKVGAQLKELSEKLAERLPPSEIVPVPREGDAAAAAAPDAQGTP